MTEAWHSIAEWWKEKTSSSLYFTYIISFLVWNWKPVYVLFLSSPSVGFQEKFAYLANTVYWGNDGWFFVLLNHICALLPPVGMTYLIIVYLPELNRMVHKKEVSEYFKRKKAYDDELTKYQGANIKYLESKVEVKKEEAKLVEKISKVEQQINKSLTQEERWSKEYEQFKNTNEIYLFNDFLRKVYVSNNYKHNFDANMLAVVDAFSLIEINGDGKVSLNEKGKYFSRLYLAKTP